MSASPRHNGRSCTTLGCQRPCVKSFKTCCRTCQFSRGRQHGPTCQALFEVAKRGYPTEHRAITVAQLRGVARELLERCLAEGWSDVHGSSLEPGKVSLYDLNYYLILPKTVPNGVRLGGLAPLPESLRPGAEVRQAARWGKRCQASGLVMEVDADASSVLVDVQMGQFLKGPSSEFVPDGDTQIVVEAEPVTHASYVGLLARSPQPPSFFISHWWGEPVLDFVRCVERHAQVRGLPDETAYWCCAYANDQHDLASEVAADPTSSSFCRALMDQKCCGVLLVLNAPGQGAAQAAVPFTRIWCAFEIFISMSGQLRLTEESSAGIQRKQLLLDIVTADEAGGVQLLTDGLTASEQLQEQAVVGRGQLLKMEREGSFPLAMVRGALQVELERAEASVELDRRHILNCLVGARDLSATPPRRHETFDSANARLRATFALAAWGRATADGLLQDLGLPAVLRGDRSRRQVALTLTGCLRGDGDLELLASGLPEGLGALLLDLSNAPITDAGLEALASRLPARTPVLKRLSLRLQGSAVGDVGLGAALASLRELPLLEDLHLSCRNLAGVASETFVALGSLLQHRCSTMQKLHLTFSHCEGVADKCMAELANGFKGTSCLHTVSLACTGCSISDKGIIAVGKALVPMLSHLRSVRIVSVQTDTSKAFWRINKQGLKRLA